MIYYFKVLMTNPLLNVPLGPSEVVVSNKHLNNKDEDVAEKITKF